MTFDNAASSATRCNFCSQCLLPDERPHPAPPAKPGPQRGIAAKAAPGARAVAGQKGENNSGAFVDVPRRGATPSPSPIGAGAPADGALQW